MYDTDYKVMNLVLLLFFCSISTDLVNTKPTNSTNLPQPPKFNYTSRQPFYNIDQQAQEQRLALQIITTDAGSGGQELKKAPSNHVSVATAKSNLQSSETENGAISFDEQYNELENQLRKKTAVSSTDGFLSRRIIIDLDPPNQSGNETDRRSTTLTIGFSPLNPSELKVPPQNHQSQQNSPISKSPESGSINNLRKSASNNNKNVLDDQKPLSSAKPQTLTAMKEAVLEALQRQGGIPAMVLSEGELEGEIAERKEPSVKFMVNSESIDLMNHRSGANGIQQVTRPMQSSESAVTGDVSLREVIENLSGEIDFLEKQLDERSESSHAALDHHHQQQHQDDGDKVQLRGQHLLSATGLDHQRESLPLTSPEARSLNHAPDSTAASQYYQMDRLDQSPLLTRGNQEPEDSEKKGFSVSSERRDSIIRDNVQVGERSDSYAEPMHSSLKALDNNNTENDEDAANERSESERFQTGNFNQVYGERTSPAFESRLNQNQDGDGGIGEHNNENTNNYENAQIFRDKSMVVGKMKSMNDLLDSPSRWRQAEEYKTPLLVDNSNLFTERMPTEDDKDGRSDVVSASVAPNKGALNSMNVDDPSSLDQKSTKQMVTERQSVDDRDNRMDERVARMLSRLKLYTTKDQLMKVAQQLQRDYPSSTPRRELELSKGTSGDAEIDRSDLEQKSSKLSLVKRNQLQMLNTGRAPQEDFLAWSGAQQDTGTRAGFSHHTTARGIDIARKQLPAPISQELFDSLLTLATTKHAKRDNEIKESGTDSGSEPEEKNLKEKQEDDTSRKRRSEDASKLLSHFRASQARMKEAVEDNSSVGSKFSGFFKDSPSTDRYGERENAQDVDKNSLREKYDQRVMNEYYPELDSQQAYEKIETMPSKDSTETIGAAGQDGIEEYTTTKDIANLMKTNEREFDNSPGQQNDEVAQTESSTKRYSIDRNQRHDNADSNLERIASGKRQTRISKNQNRAAAEIKVLEQIIDELVRRERNDKKTREV